MARESSKTLPTGFEKAYLKIENSERLDCWFNPKEYTIAKSAHWEQNKTKGSIPAVQYTGGDARTLTLELLFDDTDSPSGDIRGVTTTLFLLLEADGKYKVQDGKKVRPPKVEFGWGRHWSFPAAIQSLSVQYVLFRPDGTPIRALARLTLVQVAKAVESGSGGSNPKGQNPTTRGAPGLGSHTVRDGDSLQSIAYAAYGDAAEWRRIAIENGIDDPLRLRRGRNLALPRLET